MAIDRTKIDERDRKQFIAWQNDWVAFAHEGLGVSLDEAQQAIVRSVQHNSRTVVKSGHARGKDFVSAVISLCFLYTRFPSKVIATAPTDRQVKGIMLAEAKKIWLNTNARWSEHGRRLGGRFLDNGVVFDQDPDWYLLGFKASDRAPEGWTGFHSPNTLVVVTEASGIEQQTFDAIEGLLTGDSRLLLVLNPNRTTGEAYAAYKSPLYSKFTLSCLDAPNVVARKTIIPGQVDWHWVNALLQKPGWVTPIAKEHVHAAEGDFEWDGQWYRPSDLFRVKVIGMWPKEPEGQLIPLAWVEASHERWREWREAGGRIEDTLRLGVDVAGLGSDATVFCWRHGDVVPRIEPQPKQGHMSTAGGVKAALQAEEHRVQGDKALVGKAAAFIDTIGEGAGVYSRLEELKVSAHSVKFSESAKGYQDLTEQRTFANLRAYCYWAIRDGLDPELGGKLALPPLDDLTQDLTSVRYTLTSRGDVLLEKKDKIIARLGRSPDYGDALANTYCPGAAAGAVTGGAFEGVGIF